MLFIFCNANARVFDFQDQLLVDLFGSYIDTPPFGCKFDGVGNQIRQDLAYLDLVLEYGRQIVWDVGHGANVFLFGKRPDHIAQIFDQLPNLKLSGRTRHFARFQFGKIQNVVDQIQQVSPRLPNVGSKSLLAIVQAVDTFQQL